MDYIQVLNCEDDTFRVEYQERSLAEHFEVLGITSFDAVLAALTSWAYGEDSWRDALPWTNSRLAPPT